MAPIRLKTETTPEFAVQLCEGCALNTISAVLVERLTVPETGGVLLHL
jgi:hypothetical protein